MEKFKYSLPVPFSSAILFRSSHALSRLFPCIQHDSIIDLLCHFTYSKYTKFMFFICQNIDPFKT